MEMYRIRAVMKRHMLQVFKDPSALFDLIYWPVLDIVIWGFTARWMQENSNNDLALSAILLSSLILWGVVWRSNVDIALSFLQEMWSQNMVNLFSSPIMLSEWIVGMMLLGTMRSLGVFFYTTSMVWLFYDWNILTLGWSLLLYFPLLAFSGWIIGFFVAGILARFGQRFQTVVWAIGWLFSLIGAVFYPVHILPEWFQLICKGFPLMYVFEAVRVHVQTGQLMVNYLATALALNGLYLAVALIFFNYMFNKSRRLGLSHLDIE